MTSKQRFYYLILLVIVIVSAALRLSAIDRTVRWDEIRNLQEYAIYPPQDFLFNFNDTNNHFFNTLLMHIQYRLLGNDQDWKIRVHVFIGGLLVTIGTYYLGKELYSEEAGLIAAALTSVMYMLVEFSINARGYIFITLIYIVLLILIHRARQSTDRRLWIAIGLLSAMGFWVSPIFLYTMGTVGLWTLMTIIIDNKGQQRRKVFLYFVGAMILGGVITGAYYGLALYNTFSNDARTSENGDTGENEDTGRRLARYTSQLDVDNYLENLVNRTGITLFEETHRGMQDWTIGLLLAGLVLGTVLHPFVAKHRVPILIPTFIWLALQIGIQRTFVLERTFVFLMPIYALLVGAGWLFVLRKVTFNRIHRGILVIVISAIFVVPTFITTMTRQSLYNAWITGAMPFGKEVLDYINQNPEAFEPQVYIHATGHGVLNYYDTIYDLPLNMRLLTHRFDINETIAQEQPLLYLERNNLGIDRLATDYHTVFSGQSTVLIPIEQITEHYSLYEIYTGRPQLTSTVQNMEIAENIWYRGPNAAVEFDIDEDNQLSFKMGDDGWTLLTNRLGAYWQDYTLTLDVRILESSPDHEDLIIRFRHEGDSSVGFLLDIVTSEDEPNVAFRMDVNGLLLNYFERTYYPIETAEWLTVTLDLDGSVFTAFIDGEEIAQWEASLLTEGTLSFLTSPGAQVEIRNIALE